MPERSVKMKRFIFGFQRRVWCPKWTPASSSWRVVTTAMMVLFSLGLIGRAFCSPPGVRESASPITVRDSIRNRETATCSGARSHLIRGAGYDSTRGRASAAAIRAGRARSTLSTASVVHIEPEVTVPAGALCCCGRMHRIVTALITAALLAGITGASQLGASQQVVADEQWPWPVDSRAVARAVEKPPQPWSAGHRGADIRAAQGAVVTAVADGVVHHAGQIVSRGVVSVAHADGTTITSYEPVHPLVAEGDAVSAGQPIAVIEGVHAGCGSCLHFGVRVDDEYQDPMMWLRLERPVLLPLGDPGRSDRAWFTRADARTCTTKRASRKRHACRSASFRDWHGPASPEQP
ncbi:MAG: M23 family metallopeptidase [Agrococcus casei]